MDQNSLYGFFACNSLTIVQLEGLWIAEINLFWFNH